MEKYKFVGLDVHKETIAVAVAEANGGEVRYVGEVANTPEALVKLTRQLKKDGTMLSFCYGAGPCGYGLYRQLKELGQECQVGGTPTFLSPAANRLGQPLRRPAV